MDADHSNQPATLNPPPTPAQDAPPTTAQLKDALAYQPGDPAWLNDFLTALAQGRMVQSASAIAGVDPRTIWAWTKASTKNVGRYRCAREVGKGQMWREFEDAIRKNADRGSTWHGARLAAMANPKQYKRLAQHIHEADPNMRQLEITGGNILSAMLQAAQDAQAEMPAADAQKALPPAQDSQEGETE